MLADTLVFQFGGTSSGLLLDAGAGSQVQGFGSVVGVQGLPGGLPYSLTGTFQFASGVRGTNDIINANSVELLDAGGSWQLIGSGMIGSYSFVNQILLGGSFGPAQLANSSNTNAFEGTMVVTSANAGFLGALGFSAVAPNSPQNVASISRPGELIVGTGVFGNGPSGNTIPFSGSLTFEVDALAVPEPAELSLLLFGGLGAAGLLRKSVRR